jgi:hypothetical protein
MFPHHKPCPAALLVFHSHSCLLVPAAVSAALVVCLAPRQCTGSRLLRLLQLLLVLCLLLLAGLPRVVLHPHHLRVAVALPRLALNVCGELQAVHCAWHPYSISQQRQQLRPAKIGCMPDCSLRSFSAQQA